MKKDSSVALILQNVISSFVPIRCCRKESAVKKTKPPETVAQVVLESTPTTEHFTPTDPSVASIFNPQKPSRTILKQSTLDEFWRASPPKKNSVMYQSQPSQEHPSAEPLSLTESQLPTSRPSFLFSLPEPPDTETLPRRSQIEVDVDKVESAILSHSPVNPPDFYAETTCELRLIENCKTESRLMPFAYILSIAHKFTEIEQFISTPVIDRTTEEEVFGLLDAEQQARFDEYEQAIKEPVPHKVLPRRLTRAHNDPSDPIIVSDSSTTDDYSSATLQDDEQSDGVQGEDEEDLVISSRKGITAVPELAEETDNSLTDNVYTMQSLPIRHPLSTSDGNDLDILHRIQMRIIPCSLEILQELFHRHISAILTPADRSMSEPLTKQFMKDLTSDDFLIKLSRLDNSNPEEIKQLSDEECIYLHIVNCLRFSVCSESESERIFSQCRHICGEQRQSIGPLTLNHTFILRQSKAPIHDRDSHMLEDHE